MALSYGTVLLIIILILLPIAVGYYYRRSKNKAVHDPRQNLTPNDTNYNIKGMIEDEVIEHASKEEIHEIIDKIDKGELSSLTNEDYFRLKKKLNALTAKESGNY